MSRYTIECHRLLCPMPVIQMQDNVAECEPGDIVEAICTDPGALNDIPAWCRINGPEVIETSEKDDEYFITVRVLEAS